VSQRMKSKRWIRLLFVFSTDWISFFFCDIGERKRLYLLRLLQNRLCKQKRDKKKETKKILTLVIERWRIMRQKNSRPFSKFSRAFTSFLYFFFDRENWINFTCLLDFIIIVK
jgi:hypothetical protein